MTPAPGPGTRRHPVWSERLLSPTQEQLVTVEPPQEGAAFRVQASAQYPIVLRWLNKGSLAILDQGLISGSNFVVGILLARWLTPSLYGAYAIAFGVFVLLTLIYTALILEPMSVFGGSAYRANVRAYLRSLLWMHLVIGCTAFALVAAAAVLMRAWGASSEIAGALWGVALSAPCILFFWVVRRALYLRMAPGKATGGASLYCSLILVGLWLLNRWLLLTPFTALLLMGFAALCAGGWLIALLYADSAARNAGPRPLFTEICRRHWTYGRWALLTSLVAWIPAYIFYPLVTRFSGLAASGDLRALTNFVSPLDQTFAALSLLFLPYAARVQAERGASDFRTLARNLFLLSISASAIYWLVVVNFRESLFSLLYAGRYSQVASLLPAVAVGSILWTAAYGPAIALRAMESPKSVFVAYLVTTAICITLGTLATRAYGLKGAIWSSNLADLISLFVIFGILYSKLAHNAPSRLPMPAKVVG